jgi:2-methylcitrate dehydratase PrpD
VGITRELADFVAIASLDDIPDSVIERVKIHLLDALATGYVGTHLSWSRMVADVVAAEGGSPQASVFRAPERVTAPQAALLNGVLIGGYEANHSGHLTHSAATVTPAAMAIAERDHASGRELLLALALGTEVGCRIGYAQMRTVEDQRGFHNLSVNGPFAAAAAAGRLLGLDGTHLAWAFGIAGSQSGGLAEYAWTGAMTKRLHPGLMSRGGLESAVLASKGFTGPETIIEGPMGLFNAFAPAPRPERVLAELGDTWHLVRTMIKGYPCHGTGQPVVATLQELKAGKTIDPDAVTRVHLKTNDEHHTLAPRFLDPEPTNHMAAQCSIPYTTAVAVVRDLSDPLQYDESVLTDAQVRRIAKLVTWEALEERGDQPLHLEIELVAAGHTYSAIGGPYRGSIDNLASFDDVEDKFRRYTNHVMNEQQQSNAIAMVHGLEALDDAADLVKLLAVG